MCLHATHDSQTGLDSFTEYGSARINDALGGAGTVPNDDPNRHGAQRPEVAASGQHIVAARAAGRSLAVRPDLSARRILQDRHISIQGSRMAALFVTEVIAIMLRQEPERTPEDIQLSIRATSRRDGDTGPVWNPGFGYGKIDVDIIGLAS